MNENKSDNKEGKIVNKRMEKKINKKEEKAKKQAKKDKELVEKENKKIQEKERQLAEKQNKKQENTSVKRSNSKKEDKSIEDKIMEDLIKEERKKEANEARKAPKQYKESDMAKKIKKKKAKEKRLVVASVICMCLVLVGAVITYYVAEYEEQKKFEREKKAAQEAAIIDSSEALVKYFKCIESGDYSQLYLCIDNATKAKRSEENFIFLNKAFYGEVNMTDIEATIKKCELDNKEKKDNNDASKSSTDEGVSDDSGDDFKNDKYGASRTKIEFTTKITTDSSDFTFDNSATMIKEDDTWHVVWDTKLIYPEYEPLDKVTTTYATTLRGTIFDRDGNELANIKDNGRYYPYANAASHLVGFVSKITSEELNERRANGDMAYGSNSIVGKKGLEYAFESTVKGKGGQKITLSDSKGNEKKVLLDSEPVKGKDLKTTIDIDIQKALYEEIKNDKGCSVAINPYTGDILALVSTPAYDNNGVMKGTDSDTYNRFARSYAPGSTFKTITGAIGLDCGAFTKETSFGTSPRRWQNSSSWGDLYVTTTHSSSGVLKNALTVSDNIYFAKAALRIGSSRMRDALDKIGFNKQLPIEMNFTASQYSNTESFTSEAMLANSGYGQGQILVNPLHMASIYSAFVNEGNMIKPRFTAEGEPEYWIKNAFKKDNAETMLDCLENVVRSGTATRLRSSSLVVAGKTGTAEIKASQTDTSGTELGWFVAVTPEEEEKDAIIIVTMVENVKHRGGSSYVVGKTRNMLKKIYSKY